MADKKQTFIAEIEKAFETIPQFTLSDDALSYFEAMKISNEGNEKKKFSDNGKVIIQHMRENKDIYKNLFKCKDFESAGLTSRQASGAMRKLVNDGYCEKMGTNPTIYSLTSLGESESLED